MFYINWTIFLLQIKNQIMKKILLSLIMTANTIIVIGQSEINLGEVYIL